MGKSSIARAALLRFVLAFVVLAVIFFVTAGSLSYWQAWAYCSVLFLSVAFVGLYFLKRNPEFLERRFKMREKQPAQRKIVAWSLPVFLLLLIVPGLDYRFGWSHVPPEVSVAALAGVLLGYWMVFLTFKENAFAARTVEVMKGQKVISTGPYAFVRHPMYTGVLLMMLATPVALGSYWALLFFPPLLAVIALRALNEEEVLKRGLKGYTEYCRKVRWRLLPHVW